MPVILAIIFTSFGGALCAEQTAYVTDSLRLRMYTKPNDTSDVVESIESGDSIEVLESQGAFSRVRTYEGSTGWVKSAFLVEEPPAKLLYYTVSEQNKQLEQKIQALQNSTPATNETETNQIVKLEQDLVKQQQTNQELQEQLSLLQQKSQQQTPLETNTDQNNFKLINKAANIFSNDKPILAGLAAALLLLGFLLGMKLSSWRLRKRLHGFRLN